MEIRNIMTIKRNSVKPCLYSYFDRIFVLSCSAAYFCVLNCTVSIIRSTTLCIYNFSS